VRASGELDIATVQELRACLRKLGEADAAVTLDMTGVKFMDSSGLHALIMASNEFGDSGAFEIVPSKIVLKLLRLVDLVDRLPLASGTDGDG
jgi:anti-anti-sigma factor